MRCPVLLYAIPLALLSQAATAQCSLNGALAKTEWNLGYHAALPLDQMGAHANTVHSLQIAGFYRIPQSRGRVDAGLELTTGSYASFTRTQVFGMNGVETPMDVRYNSNVTTTNAMFRYHYFRTKDMSLFSALKGGFAGFSSKIVIEDPEDPDGCEPLEEKKLISDYTWTAGVRTGANVDMHRFIPKLPLQTFMIQVYAGYVTGGNVDYINVKNTTTDFHVAHSQVAPSPDAGRPLNVRFVNLQTGSQHSHEVARVHNSPLRFLEGGLSLVMRL